MSSDVLDVTNGVTQISVLGSLLFALSLTISLILKFSDPFTFADLKILAVNKTKLEIGKLMNLKNWLMSIKGIWHWKH